MSDLLTPDVADDPGLRELIARTVDVGKLAAIRAAANLMDPAAYPLPSDPKSLERLFAARLASRPQASRQRAVQGAKRALAAASAVRGRTFKDLAGIDLKSSTPVAEHPAARAKLTAAIRSRGGTEVAHSASFEGSEADSAHKAAPGKTLRVRIHRVICSHTTDDGAWSDDEIKLGGLAIGAAGNVVKVDPFIVSKSFVDPGDEDSEHVSQVKYDPPRKFCEWTFSTSGDKWPKLYTAVLILCEEDEGGFMSFLGDLLQKLKDFATPFLSALEDVLGVFGTILGAILDGLFGWLVSLWEDDPFYPINVQATIKSAQHVFGSGTRTSDLKKYWTTMGIGKYWIYFDWQINS
jgi:hypothetical protein